MRFDPFPRGAASIVARARVANGRWHLSVKLLGRGHEPGDRRPFTITYRGSQHLRPARLDGSLRLEIERSNPAPY